MREFCSYLLLCFTIARRGVREWIDIPATVLGIVLPLFAWRYPHFWNSEIGQIRMNALYWMVPSGLAWMYLSVRVLVSPYLVYKVERDRACGFEKELDQEKITNAPRLSGVIENIRIGLDGKQPFLLAQIAITNRGAPSIAEGYRIWLNASDSSFELKPVVFKAPQKFAFDGITTTLTTGEMIFEKTSVPITTGNKVRGWLFCPMSQEVFEKVPHGTSATLKFQDVNEAKYCSAEMPILNLPDPIAPMYAPGLGQFSFE